jgi:hypothetical protein
MKLRIIAADLEFEAEGSQDAIRASLGLLAHMIAATPPVEIKEVKPRRRKKQESQT